MLTFPALPDSTGSCAAYETCQRAATALPNQSFITRSGPRVADSRHHAHTGSSGHVVQSEPVLPAAQSRCSERCRTTRTATSRGSATVHPPTTTTPAASTVWLSGSATVGAASSNSTAAGRRRRTAAQLDAAAAADAVPEFRRRSAVYAPAAAARYPTTSTTTTTTSGGGTARAAQHGGGRTVVAVRAARTLSAPGSFRR